MSAALLMPRAWSYEVHELSEGFSAIVYDESGQAIADHLSETSARLIAAAPELYEALVGAPGLPSTFDQYDRFASEYRAFREKRAAALAKARGEQGGAE